MLNFDGDFDENGASGATMWRYVQTDISPTLSETHRFCELDF